jgi:hypothetical protein
VNADAVWPGALRELSEAADRLAARAQELDGRDSDLAVKTLGAMMGAYLTHLWGEPDHPAFLPSVGYHQMYGTPNPDTIYRTTALDGRGTYLISGYRGTVPEVTAMPMGGPTPQGIRTFPAWDLDDLHLETDGAFEVLLAAAPSGSVRNWWPLDAGMRSLMLRSVSAQWGADDEPRVAITRLDTPARRERFDPATVDKRLRIYARIVEGMVLSGLTRAAALRAAGPNRLASVDYSASGGVSDQWYQEGWFSLSGDTALVCEARPSSAVRGFSLSLTDPYFSTIDWANAHASLNHAQAVTDSGGALRWVVAASDPGVRNWLDTTGYTEGALQFRWSGGDEPPSVDVRVVPLASVGEMLAGADQVTADERAEIVRERQRGCQLRVKW